MNLPKDLSGSISKNRFRIELLWGINKIIEAHKELGDYTVIFDFKCDIELHQKDTISFFQIKTKIPSNFNTNNLCKIDKDKQNSILGKLYLLYSPDVDIQLFIVSNKHLKINNRNIGCEIQCLGELDSNVVSKIQEELSKELDLDTINLDNIYYIYDGIDFVNPENAIRGKLIKAFEDITAEEPINPNAFYRLVYNTVIEKACYELNLTKYKDVITYKGITRSSFEKMLNAHRMESINGVYDTNNFIKQLQPFKRRELNIAMSKLLSLPRSIRIEDLKRRIFKFIINNEKIIKDEDDYLNLVSKKFDDEFDIEFTNAMKTVQYLIVYYIYVGGGELD